MTDQNKSEENTGPNHRLWIIGLIALTAILFFRRGLSWLIPAVVIPGLIIVVVFWIWKNWYSDDDSKSSGIIADLKEKIGICNHQIKEQKSDLEEIEETMSDLEKQLNGSYELNQNSWKESQNLLAAFREEKKLRLQKIDFYEALKKKLKNLLYNQEIAGKLNSKRSRLKEMREDHLEDLAKMEAMRHDLEFDLGHLQSLQDLSVKMSQTNTLEKVESIRREFDKIIEELS